MTELDQIWSQMLCETEARAASSGREHVARYLRLKATNDMIRAAGVRWLFDTMTEIAGEAVGIGSLINIEREEPYRFTHSTSTMVGSVIRYRHGVRCLTVEAGWARTPSDGIMIRGALAYAHVKHFGLPKVGREFRLDRGAEIPAWITESDEAVDTSHLRSHFNILLDK